MKSGRKVYHLTPSEHAEWKKLAYKVTEGCAVDFWGTVAEDRGLDAKSIICYLERPDEFTALPVGHGKHWCWPMQLACKSPPPEFKD